MTLMDCRKTAGSSQAKKGISLRKPHWENLCSCAQALLDEAVELKK